MNTDITTESLVETAKELGALEEKNRILKIIGGRIDSLVPSQQRELEELAFIFNII